MAGTLKEKINKKSLDQMAKNLLNCSPRSLEDVIQFLDTDSSEYLILKMEEFRSKKS